MFKRFVFDVLGACKDICASQEKVVLKRLSHFEGVSGVSVMELKKTYQVQDSPYQNAIISLVDKTLFSYSKNPKELRFAENAMYLLLAKRWSLRPFEGDGQTYLSRLLDDLHTAKWEYSETNYDSDAASNTFSQFHTMITLLKCS